MPRRDPYCYFNLPVSKLIKFCDELFLANHFSLFSYHIYKQNQARLNNNNTTRVNLNLERQVPQPVAAQEDAANVDTDARNVAEPSDPSPHEPEVTAQLEPQVPFATIVRTFVLSFFSSIIPEAPAL